MTAKGKIDLLVPRGGAGLIQAVVETEQFLLSKQALVSAMSM